jgi:hypothetical protein
MEESLKIRHDNFFQSNVKGSVYCFRFLPIVFGIPFFPRSFFYYFQNWKFGNRMDQYNTLSK